MSASSPQSPIESLPTELLERIFLFTSARDILRLSSVNRTFCGLVRDSSVIQYEIDLFCAGLQHNPRTKKSLADCRAALEAYCKRWSTLDPAEKWDKSFDVSSADNSIVVVSGTYGILSKDSAKFFTSGSVSRGIPRREWEISFEHFDALKFAFHPQADVMAVVEEVAWMSRIHLSTLSDGEPHPAAQTEILSYNFAPSDSYCVDVSITGSRLAFLGRALDESVTQVTVWDWTTGQILVELGNGSYKSTDFVDDYWLALTLISRGVPASPRLVLLNTEQKIADDSTLAQTTFHFDLDEYWDADEIKLHLDRGGHKPSPEEGLLAPFYQDASQRLVAVELEEYNSLFVMKTEVLLGLARERGGTGLEWEQWKAHAVKVQQHGERYADPWVSGPRLFCVCWPKQFGGEMWLDMYDFSVRASARHMKTVTDRDERFPRVMQPSVPKHHLPRHTLCSGASHDGIVILMGDGEDQLVAGGTIHVWSF